jgi:hypothetical protein
VAVDILGRPLAGVLELNLSAAVWTAVGMAFVGLCCCSSGAQEGKGELLYNGIRLGTPWPPRKTLSLEPPPLPSYLVSPSEVIPIDVGRQLFVDDFLIENTTLTRVYHQAQYHPAGPVLKPDRPWEKLSVASTGGPTAMPFSDGVWYDPVDRLFKMWYMGGHCLDICYATSRDGVRWNKPLLDVYPGTNIVLRTGHRDSAMVWLDVEEPVASRRFKYYVNSDPEHIRGGIYLSGDGVHWGDPAAVTSSFSSDRNTFFWNPFRKVWVYSVRRINAELGRYRDYRECLDVVAGANWREEEVVPWVAADEFDLQRGDLKTQPQIYNLDAVAYESILLGLFTIWRGQPTDRPKINEVVLGYSRDGFNWYRPDRRAFIPVSERYGDWNWGNVQSAGGGCLIVRDKLYFYVSGRAGETGTRNSGVCSTGLAVLRRDGFASMRAGASEEVLTTRPVTFTGKHLFVNADARRGELRVEVLDKYSNVIAPFSRAKCRPVRSDNTLQTVTWQGGESLARLSGQPVRFRFCLRDGDLYSFWVSPDKSGASHGYVAAGGPGYTRSIDTVGTAAFRNRR